MNYIKVVIALVLSLFLLGLFLTLGVHRGKITSYATVMYVPNSVPILNLTIPNQTLPEADINAKGLDLNDYFIDPNGDEINYSISYLSESGHLNVTINGSKTLYSTISYTVFPNYRPSRWYGAERALFHAKDEDSVSTKSNSVTFFVLPDLDKDGIPDGLDPDDDNDGINDSIDTLLGDGTYVYNTNLNPFFVSVDDSLELNETFLGIHNVKFQENNRTIVKFNYNFSERLLDLSGIGIYKQIDNTTGFVSVHNLNLTGIETYTAFIEKLSPSSNSVCIKDANTSINEFNFNCEEPDVKLIACDCNTYGNYGCIIENNELKVSGCRHCAVKEHFLPIAAQPITVTEGIPAIAGGVIKKIKVLFFPLRKASINLKQNEILDYFLPIINKGDTTTNLSLHLEPQFNFIYLNNTITIPPKQTGLVKLAFRPNETILPELYITYLIVEGPGIEEKIPLLIEIKPLKPLVNIKVTLPPEYKLIPIWKDILAIVAIENLGETKPVDVKVECSIEDLNRTTIVSELDNFTVEKNTEFVKRMELPKNIKPGDYLFVAKAYSDGNSTISSEIFTVVLITKETSMIIICAAFYLLFSIISLYLYRRYKKGRRRSYNL